MHDSIKNYIHITSAIKLKLEDQKNNKIPKIIAVSKTFKLERILPLLDFGHLDYGENKVQEAIDKWTDIKMIKPSIRLHLIGKLQTNKVKFALKIFDFIHSVDSKKLAKKIADEEIKQKKILTKKTKEIDFLKAFKFFKKIGKLDVVKAKSIKDTIGINTIEDLI